MVKKILLDTDAGVDDVFALLLLLRCPDLAEIVGITIVAGNTHLENCVANVKRALGVASLYTDGKTANVDCIPVSIGAAEPLCRPLLKADEVHGPDGLGRVSELMYPDGTEVYPRYPIQLDSRPAHELILSAAEREPGAITLVAIGPLTNLAKAYQADPNTFRMLREIVLMGGTFHHDGNTTARAEFNIRVDPEAAAIVLDSGVPLTMVPLDCTEQTRLIASDMDGTGPVHEFARRATGIIIDFYRRFEGFEGVYHHDPLAVGVALDPTFAFGVHTHVAVETEGALTSGETVAMLRRQRWRAGAEPNAVVCLNPDAERFQNFFLERVLPPDA